MDDPDQHMDAANNYEIEIMAEIVSAYVSKNPVPASELPRLIAIVADTIKRLSSESPAKADKAVPAVPIKNSVTKDYIISLEDGQKFKTLKRALAARYGMTPDQYRTKWGLPHDYPMVAPGYAARRSELARQFGLGRKPGHQPKKAEKAKGLRRRAS